MAQSLTQLWVHIIFSTKNRYPFLQNVKIQQRMHAYIKKICEDEGCHVATINGVADHVHLLINLNKNILLIDLIKNIKKNSSKWIKTLAQDNFMLSKFYWQNGYGAFSVSQSQLDTVITYINNQHSHHKKFTFEEELRKFLQNHQILYDEKYLWN